MLSKAAKNEIVERFSEVFKGNPSVVLIEYKGLSVGELEGLRVNLKNVETNLTVVKNSLLKIAAKDTEIEKLSEQFAGPTAIAVCESDATAAAKVFVDSAKDLPSLVIKAGIIDGNVVSLDEITAISKLPSRQEMMAQLLGALSSPMSNLLGALTQMQTKLLYALEALKDAKEEGSAGTASEESKAEAPVEEKAEAKQESKESEPKEPKAEVKQESAEAKEESKEEASEEQAATESEEHAEEAPEVEAKAEASEDTEAENVEEEETKA